MYHPILKLRLFWQVILPSFYVTNNNRCKIYNTRVLTALRFIFYEPWSVSGEEEGMLVSTGSIHMPTSESHAALVVAQKDDGTCLEKARAEKPDGTMNWVVK